MSEWRNGTNDCEHCEDGVIRSICGGCSGSGEGAHESVRCWRCKGSGETTDTCDECEAGVRAQEAPDDDFKEPEQDEDPDGWQDAQNAWEKDMGW